MDQDYINFYQSDNTPSEQESVFPNDHNQLEYSSSQIKDESNSRHHQNLIYAQFSSSWSEILSTMSRSSSQSNTQKKKELNKYSKGYYESIYRVLTKHCKVKPGKDYQSRIIQMTKIAVLQPNSTDNFMIQQLADFFVEINFDAFCEYLKYITQHSAKRKNQDLDNEYFYFAANQILKETIKQIPQLQFKNGIHVIIQE